jgi:hypothetical protein
MPLGTRHIETDILRPDCWGYSLHMDGGGIWELDVTRSPRKLLGQRVTVEGTRAGFNLLNVDLIRLESAHPLPSPVNRRSIRPPYRRAKGTPLRLCGLADAGCVFRAAGGVGRA